MPTYLYRAPDGTMIEHFCPSKDRPETIDLPNGDKAEFDFLATIQSVAAVPPSNYPIKSRSLGVFPKQLAEARKRFPDHEFTVDGRRVIRSKAHRDKILADINRGCDAKDAVGDLN